MTQPAGFSEFERLVIRWDELTIAAQMVLAVAAEEGTLREAEDAVLTDCLSGDYPRRPRRSGVFEFAEQTEASAAFADAGTAVLWLWQRGLIGLFRLADGYPDLSAAEAGRLLAGGENGASANPESACVGMYLTPSGESTFMAP